MTLILFVLLIGTGSILNAQENVITWKAESKTLEDNVYRIEMQATIADGWHLYDLGPYGDMGPYPTAFAFTCGEGAELVGDVQMNGNLIKAYDDIYQMEIGFFEKTVTFTQDIRLNSAGADVEIMVEYMACNDMNCLPLSDTTFTFTLGDAAAAAAAAQSSAEISQGGDNATAAGAPTSLWATIIEAILWGLAMLATPCVFPMVPMTVSFFIKGSENKKLGRFRAAMYGAFIVLLYTVPIAIIILATRIIGGDAVTADIFNWLATHWLPNLIFFAVFMIFAASFFGAFEITMPSKLVNSTDQKSNKKGLGGVFFMALTLVLVSFSCTGPIVGSVLIKSIQGEFWDPIITMLAFSIAFALPFTLLAFFPSMLKKLPKSGGWLNSVKVVLGFIELALGLKFLVTADQAYHWGLIDREVNIALWIVIFSMLGFYLLGKIRFKYDSPTEHVSLFRLVLSIFVFAFVVYLIPGMWGAPLKAISGYLPPITTQDYVVNNAGGIVMTSANSEDDVQSRKYADFLHMPHNLTGFFDLNEALEYAKKVNKPVFMDFTGHACNNCREMETRVFSDPRILDMFRNEYVMVALYMDDKTILPEDEWVTTSSGKVLKSLGKINSQLAQERYGINAQPYYVLADHDGNPIVPARSYDLNIEDFVKFLKDGLAKFKESQK